MVEVRPKVKFCGIVHPADISAVNAALPDYAGLVFWPKSRRAVTADEAAGLRKLLDPRIASVGVFVDEDVDAVADLHTRGIVSVAQLHGAEDADYIRRLREAAPGLEVWKAFEIVDGSDVARAADSPADLIVLDAGKGGGVPFDWTLLGEIRRPYALAGGLTPERIAAVASLPDSVARPTLLDVSGGIECRGDPEDAADRRPHKDAGLMGAFMRAVERNFKMNDVPAQEKGFSVNETTDGGCTDSAMREGHSPAENAPGSRGRFGIHGGQYVPETLMNAVNELEEGYARFKDDPEFNAELQTLLNDYAGRPSLLYFARRMTENLGGAKIYLKREDLNHTGAHKINNVLGQALLAKKMGKTRLIAETGAGQHGVATATAAALLDMECDVYMGREDTERQALNVYRMKLLGARVHPVDSGTATLKDAVSEAMREWTNRVDDTHYCLGSVMGPHPFPTIVRDFQTVISKEIKQQMLQREGRLPDVVLACVGGGSNAIGTFFDFIGDPEVRLIGCEAAGRGIDTWETAATVSTGSLGIFHGMKSYFCQDEYGQIAPVYSISAGLDYPGVGPEHANLHDTGRAEYVPVTDEEAVCAFEYLSRTEGIIPAIESAHAVAHAMKIAPEMSPDDIMVVTLSGRGDKDCAAIARYRGEDIHE